MTRVPRLRSGWTAEYFGGFDRTHSSFRTPEHAFRGLVENLTGNRVVNGSRTQAVLDYVLGHETFDSKDGIEDLLGYKPRGGPRGGSWEYVTRRLQSGQPLNFGFLRDDPSTIDSMIRTARRMSGGTEAVDILQRLKTSMAPHSNLTAFIGR